MQGRKAADQDKLAKLQTGLRTAEERLDRLYDAVESGTFCLDDVLQRHTQQLKASRESVLVEMAGLRRAKSLPVERILQSQVQAFSKAIRAKLTNRASSFAKDYLRALVKEIRVEGKTATISGS